MRAVVRLMLLHAACCAALDCSGSQHEFEHDAARPAGWKNADQRFAAKKERDGHHQIKCESARTPAEGNKTTFTRATMEFKLADIGIGGQWGEALFTLPETRFRIQEVNGVNLSEENDGNAKATTVVPPSYEKYKLCSSGDDNSFMEFGDALVLESTYAGFPGLKVSAYGFRSEEAKKRVLEGNQLFAVNADMGSCRMEIVAEIPVPANGTLSFKIRFYVHNEGWGKTEEEINAALQTREVGSEIVVSYQDTELMGMSTGLVCKSTKLAVPAANVTRERIDGAFQGEVWKYSVPRSLVASCGAVVFDPRMTPPNAPTLSAPAPGDAQADATPSDGRSARSVPFSVMALTVVSSVWAWCAIFSWP